MLARKLRKNQTPQEKLLWEELRNRRFCKLKFYRQYVIHYGRSFFIADFYCDSKKLVIEVDGEIHEFQKENDRKRDEMMNGMGISVLRIDNYLFKDMDRVKQLILDKINDKLPHSG